MENLTDNIYLESFYGKRYLGDNKIRCGYCDNPVEFVGEEYDHTCEECKKENVKMKRVLTDEDRLVAAGTIKLLETMRAHVGSMASVEQVEIYLDKCVERLRGLLREDAQ